MRPGWFLGLCFVGSLEHLRNVSLTMTAVIVESSSINSTMKSSAKFTSNIFTMIADNQTILITGKDVACLLEHIHDMVVEATIVSR